MANPLVVKAVQLEHEAKWDLAADAYLECEQMNTELINVHRWAIDAHYWRKESELCKRLDDLAWSWSLITPTEDGLKYELERIKYGTGVKETLWMIWGYNLIFITKAALMTMYQGMLSYPQLGTKDWIAEAKSRIPEYKETNIRPFYYKSDK
jgi:hypothetical protein